MDITGRKLFVKALEEEGVDTVFVYPGGNVTDIFDELYKQFSWYDSVFTPIVKSCSSEFFFAEQDFPDGAEEFFEKRKSQGKKKGGWMGQ